MERWYRTMNKKIIHLLENETIPCKPTLSLDGIIFLYFGEVCSIDRKHVTCQNCLQLSAAKTCVCCNKTLLYKEFHSILSSKHIRIFDSMFRSNVCNNCLKKRQIKYKELPVLKPIAEYEEVPLVKLEIDKP